MCLNILLLYLSIILPVSYRLTLPSYHPLFIILPTSFHPTYYPLAIHWRTIRLNQAAQLELLSLVDPKIIRGLKRAVPDLRRYEGPHVSYPCKERLQRSENQNGSSLSGGKVLE
jgi:hypothetical protein